MPRKSSPLSSTSIGNFTWSYIFIGHMICVLLGASCMIWVFAFYFTTIILAVHTFWERHTWFGNYASHISFELYSFALVLHLYLFKSTVVVLFYRNYWSLMLHLYYFESLIEQQGNLLKIPICLVCKINNKTFVWVCWILRRN